MSDALWVVRAGEKGRYSQDFLRGSFIAVGFSELAADDLSQTDEQSLKARVTNPAERIYASQLISFAYKVEVGDLVIVPRTQSKSRDYLVGRVTGPYQYLATAAASGHHRRAVEWLGAFDRDALSQSGLNTLGAIQTVFRPNAVESELRTLLTALNPVPSESPKAPSLVSPDVAPIAPDKPNAAPVAITPPPRRLATAQLDIELDDQGRARIVCGYPALTMEQTPRHLDPSADWTGVPGVYVLTGTDLEHSSTRTGRERTLTTTLIVRPWAYVGLSEDFLGRLGSHRQTKAEWRRALLVRSGGTPFTSDDIKYLERRIHEILVETDEVRLAQATPRGNLSAQPRNPGLLDACAETVVAVLRLTGTLI